MSTEKAVRVRQRENLNKPAITEKVKLNDGHNAAKESRIPTLLWVFYLRLFLFLVLLFLIFDSLGIPIPGDIFVWASAPIF